jgi:hypothetical protein
LEKVRKAVTGEKALDISPHQQNQHVIKGSLKMSEWSIKEGMGSRRRKGEKSERDKRGKREIQMC